MIVGSPTASERTKPQATVDPQQTFGLPESTIAASEVAAGNRPPTADKVIALIRSVKYTANGRGIFTLDNEQVWRQLIADGDVLAKAGDEVTLSRGVLGSFWLKLKSGRACKVTRLH